MRHDDVPVFDLEDPWGDDAPLISPIVLVGLLGVVAMFGGAVALAFGI